MMLHGARTNFTRLCFVFIVIATLLLACLCATATSSESIAAAFPLQMSAEITITAHLIEESSQYPPRVRKLAVYYDYINKRARADIEQGLEAAKTCKSLNDFTSVTM